MTRHQAQIIASAMAACGPGAERFALRTFDLDRRQLRRHRIRWRARKWLPPIISTLLFATVVCAAWVSQSEPPHADVMRELVR